MSNQPTNERFLIYRETPCPKCNGGCWDWELDDHCSECDGLGVKMEEIAVLSSLKEIEAFLPERIPFQGEAFYPQVYSEFEECF